MPERGEVWQVDFGITQYLFPMAARARSLSSREGYWSCRRRASWPPVTGPSARIFHTLTLRKKPHLINTLLQRGYRFPSDGMNRFNGFVALWQTVETVCRLPLTLFTPLKQGVNESARFASQFVYEISRLVWCSSLYYSELESAAAWRARCSLARMAWPWAFQRYGRGARFRSTR